MITINVALYANPDAPICFTIGVNNRADMTATLDALFPMLTSATVWSYPDVNTWIITTIDRIGDPVRITLSQAL